MFFFAYSDSGLLPIFTPRRLAIIDCLCNGCLKAEKERVLCLTGALYAKYSCGKLGQINLQCVDKSIVPNNRHKGIQRYKGYAKQAF
jgi:hypothetical protein